MKDTFDCYAKPMLAVTVHLDRVTRQLCSHTLHLFIVFNGSDAEMIGPEVKCYIEGFMDKVCHQRKSDGLPGEIQMA